MTMRCMVMAERICVKKHAVMFVSTSELSDGSMSSCCILMIGGMPWRMFISIGNAIETWTPFVFHRLPAEIRHPGHVDEQVVGSEPDIVAGATGAGGEVVQDRTHAERRKDVRRDLQPELAPDRPCLGVGRFAKVDLAAHDHGGELVARGEPALLDAERVVGYWLPATLPALSK